MSIQTEVLDTGKPRFDQVGRFLGYPLTDTDKVIAPSIAKLVLKYAKQRAVDAGLSAMVEGWEVLVGTMDGTAKVKDRSYYVTWKNKQGTEITLNKIEMNNGRPFLDFRFSIEE